MDILSKCNDGERSKNLESIMLQLSELTKNGGRAEGEGHLRPIQCPLFPPKDLPNLKRHSFSISRICEKFFLTIVKYWSWSFKFMGTKSGIFFTKRFKGYFDTLKENNTELTKNWAYFY